MYANHEDAMITCTEVNGVATAEAMDGAVSCVATVEGERVHIVRNWYGTVQHKYLRADVHADLWVAAHADLGYLLRCAMKAA